ncbi:hypothetical protein ACI65C_006597 [Semiaphis heraclei]
MYTYYSPKHVRMWGCLWAWSAFPFEHFNGSLCKLFQGTQGVPEQICKNYQLEWNLRNGIVIFTLCCFTAVAHSRLTTSASARTTVLLLKPTNSFLVIDDYRLSSTI